MEQAFNWWVYLAQVAPVVLVMGVGLIELWRSNQKMVERIYQRDMENLKTLEQMLAALTSLQKQGELHFEELRTHISEQAKSLRSDLNRD